MSNKNLNRLNNNAIPKKEEKKCCFFCKKGWRYIDYCNPEFLKKCLNPQGKILRRYYRGHCKKHQKAITSAVKKARILALLPFVVDNFKTR